MSKSTTASTSNTQPKYPRHPDDSHSGGLVPGYKYVEAFGPDEDYASSDSEDEDNEDDEFYVVLDMTAVDQTLVPSSSSYRLIVCFFFFFLRLYAFYLCILFFICCVLGLGYTDALPSALGYDHEGDLSDQTWLRPRFQRNFRYENNSIFSINFISY